jgi:hypothetical protein
LIQQEDAVSEEKPKLTNEQYAQKLTEALANSGMLIYGGWKLFEKAFIPPIVSDQQRHDMMIGFIAGADHLWYSLLATTQPGDDLTEGEEKRMEMIENELQTFREYMKSIRTQPSVRSI